MTPPRLGVSLRPLRETTWKFGIKGCWIEASNQDSCTHNKLIFKASGKIINSISFPIRDLILQFNIARGCILNSSGGGSMMDLPSLSSSEPLRSNRKAQHCKDSSDLGPRRLKRRLQFICVKNRTHPERGAAPPDSLSPVKVKLEGCSPPVS